MSTVRATEGAKQPTKFGTFGGVFTPCVLTILGVIMFLRFGQVVGQSGIRQALLIVVLAKIITLLTTLSLSAIATNTRVKGGGAYFLISRSLGVEFGGAIGVVFYLAQAISVAMYVIGFAIAFTESFSNLDTSITTVATVTNVVVFVCVFIGAGWTVRLQYGILAILVASVVSFFAGALPLFSAASFAENFGPGFTDGESTLTMFALFFPAVTGIMAGANMSGDLQDPGRSIPSGTLQAVFVTALVYIGMAVVLGGAADRSGLIENALIIKQLAWSPLLITAGVFAATLSSALGSMMGAPRILQALARDKVFRRLLFFAAGSGPANEPRRATVITFLISQVCILAGELNTIAPIITMFFMITYGTINLATFYESMTRNPSYRPRFQYCHWSTALAGALGCFGVMFFLSPTWAAASMVVMAIIYKLISFKEVETQWGDLQSGILFQRTRRNLLKLEDMLAHPKNWRPTVLALTGAGGNRKHLSIYGHWFTSGHGILTLAQVITGEVEDLHNRRRNQEELLRKFIAEEEIEAFPAVVVGPNFTNAVESLVQCHGLGGMQPNTVLLGWPKDADRIHTFGSILRIVKQLGRSLICIRAKVEGDSWQIPQGTIDVYWRGKENGPLMLLLAHLLTQNDQWRGQQIRLIRVITAEAGRDEVMKHLVDLIETSRIRATPVVAVGDDIPRTIQQTSANAAKVFLGFQPPDDGGEATFYKSIERIADQLPRVVLVWSAGGMQLTD